MLVFCLAECLCTRFSLEAIAAAFCRWYTEDYWTPHGEVFDIGNATQAAIMRLQQGVSPIEAGGKTENSNGNGSLMRILPIAYFYRTLDFPELIRRSHQVSCITHAHERSQIACGIYISIAVCLLKGLDLRSAYIKGIENLQSIYSIESHPELSHFNRVLSENIDRLSVDSIRSGGYVIDTLEASLWCLLNTSSYAEAVLQAVNLGGDTDTTAAVTGGLAGIYYGVENIPTEWIEQTARKEDIMNLAARLEASL